MAPINVFLSYSHKNEDMRNELETHFAVLKRDNIINLWHDHRLTAGTEIDPEIKKNLEDSDVFLFLISPYFLDSNYCYETELALAEKKASSGQGIIIPIILDPCEWLQTPLKKYKALPKDGIPISKWPNIHDALLGVTSGIRRVAEALDAKPRTNEVSPKKGEAPPKKPSLPRSSNLRVKKEFNDLEKKDFVTGAFEFIGKTFEGSAQALEERNKEIQSRVNWKDNETFEAEIYRGGKLISQCRIWLSKNWGGSTPGIAFFHGDLGFHGTNSYHEMLQVEDDGYILFLDPTMKMGSWDQEQKLTARGGAELLWGKFIEPLQ